MARGRLIFPFDCTIERVDAGLTAHTDGGYDDDFRAPTITPGSGSARGAVVRETCRVTVPAQVESDEQARLRMLAAGKSPKNHRVLIFHFRDLERLSLVDAAGKPLLGDPGDKLVEIREPGSCALVEDLSGDAGGFYAVEARSIGFGLGPKRNLFLVVFEQRDRSAPR